MLYKRLIIEKIQQEVEGFKTFTFKEGHGIHYKAGQYLTFVQKTLHEEIRRSYSITSSPLLNEALSIGIKRIENGMFSRTLIDHAQPGDELITTGAGGFFVLPDDLSTFKQIFFLAAGSGITPIMSLLKTVLHIHPHIHVVLIYSNTSPAKTIFYSALNRLHEKFNNRFQLCYLFSNAANLAKARLNRELLEQLSREHLMAEKDQTLFYLCGPEAYMRMCTYTLQEEKVPKENIRKETFLSPVKAPPQLAPPDKHPRIVTIDYGHERFEFAVQYPDSILQAAKKRQIVLPYSCEVGRCGNCVASCTSGKVWLSYNEVLTEKDLQNGLTLTCVGHPVDGDVTLKIELINSS